MQSALTAVPGVKDVSVAMPDKAEVTGSASADALVAAIKAAGYTAMVQ